MDTFCVTTENSTFVCRQGDNITITGNCIFGASGKKVASTLNIDERLGKQKKDAFLSNIGLDKVIHLLEKMVAKNKRSSGGYIELPFGYYVFCNQNHKLFNYLDQGTEAVCQKWAANYFKSKVEKLGLSCETILQMHDESLIECSEDIADDVGKIMCESYEAASYAVWEWHKKHSKWFVGDDMPDFCFNLDGGYVKGNTYYDCH